MFQSELLQVEINSFENLMKFIKEFDENNLFDIPSFLRNQAD